MFQLMILPSRLEMRITRLHLFGFRSNIFWFASTKKINTISYTTMFLKIILAATAKVLLRNTGSQLDNRLLNG